MSKHTQKFWGPVLVLVSFAMPFPMRPVPEVVFGNGFSLENTIFCNGCNPLVFGQPLNLNLASIEHLMLLPSIGEKRAMEIVEHRKKYGSFSSLSDINNVPGIGPKTILKIKPYIVIE